MMKELEFMMKESRVPGLPVARTAFAPHRGILPRLPAPARFELESGTSIAPMLPGEATRLLWNESASAMANAKPS